MIFSRIKFGVFSLSWILIIFTISVAILSQPQSAMSVPQKMGTITIDLMSVSGEREDYHGTSLKIYQDNSNSLFQTIDVITGNPYDIYLPIGHLYKIELYVNGMYSSVRYISLDSDSNELQFNIPPPGSVRFTVVYNDGFTPIDNSTIMITSNDGSYRYWTNSTTDDNGNSIRFWLQPTIIDTENYVATIFTSNGLTYSYPFDIMPGLSTDNKIVTPWPNELPIITVSVYKSGIEKVTKSDGNFLVELYDNAGNKVAESKVDAIGEAHFPGLKVGSFVFRAIELSDTTDPQWSTDKIILDGKQTDVQIFTNSTAPDDKPVLHDASATYVQIPSWVRNNAKWWAENQISDSDFVSGIQYLIQQHIVMIPSVSSESNPSLTQIPYWIKSNAGLWAESKISDGDFIKAVQYLISNG